jgi:hypothetical protein
VGAARPERSDASEALFYGSGAGSGAVAERTRPVLDLRVEAHS